MNSRSRWFLPALALALAASTLAGAAPDRARVWVEFAPGSAAAVGGALRQAGGQIHYRFDHLSAYAVTLPAAALPGFARNPNVVLIEDDPKRFPMAQSVPYGICSATTVHGRTPRAWSPRSISAARPARRSST